jgi:transglutaminase-like putative cysteine protease
MKPTDSALKPRSVVSLLAALATVCAPHVQRLPLWLTAGVGAMLLWRGWIALRGGALPSRWALIGLVVVGSSAVILSYGPMLGRDAAVALLAVMTALKAMELRSLRDATVVVCLGYFLIITNFLYSQSLATAWFMLGVMLWLTATMIALHDHGGRLPAAEAVRGAGTLLVQAAPLMLALFLLFPRVQGPIFGFPQATSSAVSGLSDRMAPGTLSNLGLSDEVAFRVQFESPAPKAADLYWRGPVLWDFDGRTWTTGEVATRALPSHEPGSAPIQYTVTLEPHHFRWMFAIDLPASAPAQGFLTTDYQLLAFRPVRNRLRYDVSSHLAYRYGAAESNDLLQRALQLPRGYNPRSHELARSLRLQSRDERELIANTLNVFRTQLFFYTLVPPELGRDSVDEFLFRTRRGFCEHYASAFVFLMRAAGLPARVVTGYQGGEMNPLGDYLIVRQSEAHAWAEVWLPSEGWRRVDPTAAVSPARIEIGIGAAVPQSDPLPLTVRGNFQLLNQLRYTLDALSNSWNQWVLGYTPDRQLNLLRRAGVAAPSWPTLAALLLAVVGAVIGLLALVILLRLRDPREHQVERAWRRFCAKLARRGTPCGPAEGPLAFARRAAALHPALAREIDAIASRYIEARYALAGPRVSHELRALVRAFSP